MHVCSMRCLKKREREGGKVGGREGGREGGKEKGSNWNRCFSSAIYSVGPTMPILLDKQLQKCWKPPTS